MAVKAFGTLFKVGNGASTEVFTALGQVTNIEGISPTQNTDDTTHMASAGGYEEHITTTRNPGTVQIDVNFEADAADQIALYQTKFNAGTIGNYQIAYSDVGATTCTFAASVESYSISSPVNGKASISLTFKLSGEPDWA